MATDKGSTSECNGIGLVDHDLQLMVAFKPA